MNEMTVSPLPPERFDDVLPPQRAEEFGAGLAEARAALGGRTVWHVNSTGEGGGVAEVLQSVVGYLLGGGISSRWLVIDGSDDFFAVTKRLHFMLQGEGGVDGELDGAARQVYDDMLGAEGADVAELVGPGDPVILHDPQTIGLAPRLRARGAHVIWSCHIGADLPTGGTRAAWEFLRPYVGASEAQGFSRASHVWDVLDRSRVKIIPPCLDAFSPKNQHLDHPTVAAVLDRAGIVRHPGVAGRPSFDRGDGTRATVRRRARSLEDAPLGPDATIVTQVSRWDPLKDHLGVMNGFVRHVPAGTGAHLVLAGPDPDSIVDDPGSQDTFRELCAARSVLDPEQRSRVHIACLPMDDVGENAAIVNALQRRSEIVVQKSLAEGFGLTVAEAMWKGRPTIGTRVGGIQEQVDHGRTGWLVDDPCDLPAFGRGVTALLADRGGALALGRAGQEKVRDEYLAPRYLCRYLGLIGEVIAAKA